MSEQISCAIIGSGNIGTDLMIKILRKSKTLKMAVMVGVDPNSDGLARAERLGVATTHEGLKGLMAMDCFSDIKIIFDATSAKAHLEHDRLLQAHDITLVDLTPAAVGPFCVPVVNLESLKASRNVNMVTCGGQATIPIVHAVSRVATVHYGEIVASIASKSAGPGTRANIDEFTETTASAIEKVGGAKRGKAIIILNPAEPPMLMRDTVFTLSEGADEELVAESIQKTIKAVQGYVPGYRLKQEIQFERVPADRPLNIPGIGLRSGLKTTVFLQVEGAAHYLPSYAGNLDIMTSAALATGEQVARHRALQGVSA
jgi:acetaldehyde dehydrogenase